MDEHPHNIKCTINVMFTGWELHIILNTPLCVMCTRWELHIILGAPHDIKYASQCDVCM